MPTMSGAMTRKLSASEGITSRQLTHARTPGPEPWIISTGGPAPRSWQLVATPPASTVRAISGLDMDTSFMRVLLELHHDVAEPRRPPEARLVRHGSHQVNTERKFSLSLRSW